MRRGYQPTLAQVFSFDAVDLAANRAGQLSPDQAVMFTNMAGMARRRPWRVLVLLAFAVVVAIVMLAAQGAPADQLTIAGGACAVMVALVTAVSMLNLRQARAMERPAVQVTQGRPVKTPSMTIDRWWMDVGGVRFSIDRADADLFSEHTVYRIYHADLGVGSPGILSVEVLAV
ncbi:MAG: hypothetical protein H6513_17260 [Acidimicrobiaceae bacterium]|nr:hypothetical protein [Acidimicrobiaceae bacterium]MCO5329744.1 hypothetical protein [Ilumatobacteraceae bacterium]